jgi:hypothetical protein
VSAQGGSRLPLPRRDKESKVKESVDDSQSLSADARHDAKHDAKPVRGLAEHRDQVLARVKERALQGSRTALTVSPRALAWCARANSSTVS